MKIKIVSMLQSQRRHERGHQQLIRSLDHFGYDYHVIDPQPYRGFGDKLIGTAAYVETIKDDYTHFVFLDGTDTFALAGPDILHVKAAVLSGKHIYISCEKALWPGPAEKYRENYNTQRPNDRWIYPNSGSYLAPIDVFLDLWERHPVPWQYDDQLWFHDRYADTDAIARELNCSIFQSIAFPADDEFATEGSRVHNLIEGALPVFIHGNGGTKMDWVYNLLP